jgi:hypothetical protein
LLRSGMTRTRLSNRPVAAAAATTGRRWRGCRAARAVGLALVLLMGGCSTTIIPPLHVEQPVTVYVVDMGRTPSLVIPTESGQLVRYAYGEWRWYALNETGALRGLAALLWPTRGALGRAELPGEPGLATVERQLPGAAGILALTVDAALVREFEQRMERLYARHRATEVYAPHVRMYFVHHPRRYTWFRNSNHAVAAWLRELGCATRGLSYRSRWAVEPPDG